MRCDRSVPTPPRAVVRPSVRLRKVPTVIPKDDREIVKTDDDDEGKSLVQLVYC
jgi:hypothetical protein